MSATEARVHFGEVLRRVSEGGESIVVERGGEPRAVVIPFQDFQRLQGQPSPLAAWLQKVDNIAAQIRRERGAFPDDLDIDALIEGGHAERDDAIIEGLC